MTGRKAYPQQILLTAQLPGLIEPLQKMSRLRGQLPRQAWTGIPV
jgi:hypothetical protein